MTDHGPARHDSRAALAYPSPDVPRRLPARLRGRRPLVVPFSPARTSVHGPG